MRRSQMLKITDTHVDYEYINGITCCRFVSDLKVNHHISLDHIWLIHYDTELQQLQLRTLNNMDQLSLAEIINENTHPLSIRGLIKSSNTPKLIKDAIIQRRLKKTQTKPYAIPNITSTFGLETISLISENALITYKNEYKNSSSDNVAFVDGLGSVIKYEGREFYKPSILQFYKPPVGDYCDGWSPEFTMWFRDHESCATFRKAVEDSRDSFK